MASLIIPGKPGTRRMYSQVLHEARPLTSCTGWAMLGLARFGGIDVTDPRAYGVRGRRLTGVSEVDDRGRTQGTSVSDWQRAWSHLAPWVEFETGWRDHLEVFGELEAGEIAIAIGARYSALPTRQRRWSPRFTGNHRFVVWRARVVKGVRQGLLGDALVPDDDWPGEWVDWSDIRHAMAEVRDARGKPSPNSIGDRIWVASMERGAGMRSMIDLVRPLAAGATVAVPKGADVFKLSQLSLVKGKPATKGTYPADRIVRPRYLPTGPTPTGLLVGISGGALDGAYVRTTQVTVTEPPPPDATQAELDAAYARGRSDERALYQAVEGDVFTRAES